MRAPLTACLLALLPALPMRAQESPAPRVDRGELGLRYKVQVRLRGETSPLETRFMLVPTPAKTTRNRVKKPRLGGWRLEADRTHGTPYAQPLLLARAERLLYLSGPSPQTSLEPYAIRFGNQACPVWKVDMPPGLKVHGYLVEVAPNLLALCDLSATFDRGEVATLELHLEGFRLRPGTAPPEEGTALLATLQRWSLKPGYEEPADAVDEGVEQVI